MKSFGVKGGSRTPEPTFDPPLPLDNGNNKFDLIQTPLLVDED